MGVHRKPRTRLLDSPAARRGALGFGAAALSASLLTQPAYADDDEPSEISEARDNAEDAAARAAEVKERVDRLYREAGTATQDYLAAEEATEEQQERVDTLLDDAATAADDVNEARRTLGQFAAAQYRHGTASETATLLLVENPQDFFDLSYKLGRITGQQQRALDDFVGRQGSAEQKRTEATEALEELQEQQDSLREQKESVQGKLAEARDLLEGLNEEEAAHLAELEELEQAEAERRAAERRAEAERQAREEQEREEAERRAEAEAEAERDAAREEEENADEQPPPSDGDGGTGDDDGYAAKAAQAVAFAEQQLGKPYVWSGSGPDSWDCSGLTQGAWRAAGVELPRVTYDQVNAGTRVSRDAMLPGDLVFFYDDISHVGIYIGGGEMIHASRPGDDVKIDPVDYMPFHSAVRPA